MTSTAPITAPHRRSGPSPGREPTDVAMSDVRRTLTWADLERETIQFGRGLEARGLVPGDHVAVVARNHVEFLVAIIGSQRAGMVDHAGEDRAGRRPRSRTSSATPSRAPSSPTFPPRARPRPSSGS